MEKADQADPEVVVNAVHVQSPDRNVVRRRMVQSTLFPLKPHEGKVENSEAKRAVEVVDDEEECCGSQGIGRKTASKKGGKKVEEIVDDDVNDKDEGCCGSQEKSRKVGKKSTRNTTPRKRASKKVAVNGKDSPVIEVDNTESPVKGSPKQLKDKQCTPSRNRRAHGKKGSCLAKVPTHPVASDQALQSVPDLWLEARKTAEENSRLFSGKQVHPFFTAWKAGKKVQDKTEVENNGCLGQRKENHDEFSPIHVFENIQVEAGGTDWSNWTLCEGPFGYASCDQENTISFSDGISASSNFGTDLNITKPSGLSLCPEDLFIGHPHSAHEDTCAVSTSGSPVVIDEEVSPYDLLKNMEKDFEMNKLGFMTGNSDEQQKAILLESIMSYYLNRGNNPENSLWTNKYQPVKALEVCGSSESVKFINEWLHLWHSTDFRVSRRPFSANKCLMREDDDSYDYDSDMENVDDASGLKNVLLVTGPVGSGKTAAIYACAKEQGFQVIEVSASDWRNGALLKQKFGEAVGSHSLKRSQENLVGSPNKLNLNCSPNKAAAFDLNKSVFEVVSLSEEEDSMDGMQCAGDGRVPCDRSEIKTVILFEDVDATLCEDRGFISTIQQLADTGKRPMILTSNSENPLLPDSLAREEVCFTMPLLKELMDHVYLVCASEKASVQPCLIKRCINFCGGDIRKTLTHLQFWCQSKGFLKDGSMRTMCSPLMFNLEAGHCVLPRLIPWELPSSLSLFIEGEIANTSCKISTEETDSLLEVLEEEVDYTISENNMNFGRRETASVEAKKEAILRRNCFQHVDNDIIAVSNMYEFSDSPVAFARRNVRRKLGTVLTDSEDEIPGVSGGLGGGNNNSSVPSNEFLPIPCPTMNTCDAEPKLPLETSQLKQINISPAANSTKPNGQCVDMTEANFAEIQDQHIGLEDVNNNNKISAHYSFNQLADPFPHPVEARLEANGNIFSVVDQVNQNSPAINNCGNQSAENVIQFMEASPVKKELGNDQCEPDIANFSVIPLSDCGESKMGVKRCLFPQALDNHPIPFTVDTQLNQSTDEIVNQSSQEAAHYSGNSLISKLLFVGGANLENMKGKNPEIANVNLYSSVAVDNSLNQSTRQIFHSVEDEQLEFHNHYRGGGSTSHINYAPVVDTSFQLCNQFLGIAKPEEIQEQPPKRADVKHWITMTHLSLFEENKIESTEHQFPATTCVDVEFCPIVGNSMNPVSGMLLQFEEENQSQYSEATDLNHVNNGCLSLDISRVPESTFVPETEANDEMEFPSGDFTEIVSPFNADNVFFSVNHKNSPHIQQCSDINLNVSNDEMGDSQRGNEYLEASTSGCQMMDECSRMDFCKRSKSFRRPRLPAKNPVQEKWIELRQNDLKQHFASENKHAGQILELAYGMSHLISEADLLLHSRRFLTNDSLDQEISLGEESLNFGWHDQQAQMASAIAEHGYCLYAKSIDSLRLNMGTDKKVQLAWELLASTNDSMALGKLLRIGTSKTQTFLSDESLGGAAPTVDICLTRERETGLQNMVQSIAPLKSHLALRGDALHDYLSSLAHISSSEASRMAEAAGKRKGRRVRVAKNYLSSGGLDLSSDDITLLNSCSFYRKG